MAQRRHHYERAFEELLRRRRVPYVAVDESRRALLPLPVRDQPQSPSDEGESASPWPASSWPASSALNRSAFSGSALSSTALSSTTLTSATLKSFDFVIYAPGGNLLVDIKGRHMKPPQPPLSQPSTQPAHRARSPRQPRLESWVAREDVTHLQAWSAMFGAEFQAAFVFLYACDRPPTSDLFDEIFEYDGTWYAPRVVRVDQYAAAMRVRSPRWDTVDLDPQSFMDLGGPLLAGRW
jgi:hypothetical protein